jgi:hypothetical protein
MAGAGQSSTASKLNQSASSMPRGASSAEKAKCRDDKAILAFSSRQHADETVDALRAENEELRRLLTAAEESLVAAGAKDDDWKEQEREYSRMLEEKTDLIRELHLKIQDLQQLELQQAAPAEESAPSPPSQDAAELCALSDELEHERNQLKEDEKTLMQQMRLMEVQMSRERAELARQRSEIERLHQEVRDELEQASREDTLKDRLMPLMRRQSEIVRNGSSEPPSRKAERPGSAPAPAAPAATSGIFRRLFNSGK